MGEESASSMNGNDVATLSAKLDGIADLINEKLRGADERADERFKSVEQKVESLIPKVVTTEICQYRHSETATEIKKLIPTVAEHEKRMVRLERVYWLQVGLYGIITPIIIWYVIRLLSGG